MNKVKYEEIAAAAAIFFEKNQIYVKNHFTNWIKCSIMKAVY